MPEVSPNFKQPKAKKAKGRARPDEPLSERCQVPLCGALATERHHILPRSAGGTDAAENTMDTCGPCHAAIHAYPSKSYQRGYLKRRTA